MRSPRAFFLRTLAACLLAALNTDAAGAETEVPPLAGQASYLRHCASCHGADGSGTGPARGWLVSPPRDLRSSFLQRYAAPELVDRLLAGARLQIELDPEAVQRRRTETDALVAYLQHLPEVPWARFDRGWDIYVRRCESCHGPYGQPSAAGAASPDFASRRFQAGVSDSELATTVRHGRRGMPALVPRIPEADAIDLVAFVRELSPGFAVYQQTCVQCHGERGRGVGSFVESFELPTTVFDRRYFERADPDDLRNDIWHMLEQHRPRMPHFRTSLSREEAEKIVTYLQAQDALPQSRATVPTLRPNAPSQPAAPLTSK